MKKGHNQKVLFSLFILGILFLSLIAVSFVSAQQAPLAGTAQTDAEKAAQAAAAKTVTGGGVICENMNPGAWKDRCTLWLGGISKADENQITVIGQMVKWIMLLIIILLIYSSLAAVEFPSQTGIRIALAVILGFLATFLITTQELLTVMQGYTAMGIAFAVFLPFFVLGAFTILIARTLNPIGIYLQKVLWLIFTIYLGIKTWFLWEISDTLAGTSTINPGLTNLQAGQMINVSILWFFKYPLKVTSELLTMAKNSDSTVLITLLVACIFSAIIMFSNKIVLSWFANQELESEIQKERSKVQKSSAYDTIRAQEMGKADKA